LKTLLLKKPITDLYGNFFPGKPETTVDAEGKEVPVYAGDGPSAGKQNRLPLQFSDFLADQLVNGEATPEDEIPDEYAFAWAKELDASGYVSLGDNGGDEAKLFNFIKRLRVTRVFRASIRQIWNEAVQEATVTIEHNIS
jgi:hypothetical protein